MLQHVCTHSVADAATAPNPNHGALSDVCTQLASSFIVCPSFISLAEHMLGVQSPTMLGEPGSAVAPLTIRRHLRQPIIGRTQESRPLASSSCHSCLRLHLLDIHCEWGCLQSHGRLQAPQLQCSTCKHTRRRIMCYQRSGCRPGVPLRALVLCCSMQASRQECWPPVDADDLMLC